MKKQQLHANLMLLLAAFFWGSTFVAQSVGADHLSPFAFQGIRNLLGAVVLLPVIALRDRLLRHDYCWKDVALWKGGILCGIILFAASNLQQTGLQYIPAGKSGFVTALYIVLVPLLGLLFHKRPTKWVWCGVALAVAGMYLLCITESFNIGKGDLYTPACALCFSFHILAIDRFAPQTDGVRMSCIQFVVCGTLSLITMLLLGRTPTAEQVAVCWLPIAYASIFSSGVAYTLQILGQRDTNPTVASILMSMESVFAVLSGWVVLHERLSARELAGCILMLCAIVLAQLPEKQRSVIKN